MKKIFSLVAFAATLAGLAACNKENSNVPSNDELFPKGENVSLQIGIEAAGQTKATGIVGDETDEAKVNSLQVLVFRGDALDAYGTVANSKSITVSCTAGDRVVYALVNGQDMKAVQTKTEFLAKISLLSNNSITNFEMLGVKNVTLPQTSTVSIDVDRIAARVVLKKITNNLTSPALQALEFGVDDIYVTNVPGNCLFKRIVPDTQGGTVATFDPSVWYNKMKYESTNCIAAFHHDAPASKIVYTKSDATAHYFYAYPNPAEASTVKAEDFINAGEWSARRTKLVLKCHIGPDTYYYPIILPVLENNKSYEINEISITRPGSDSEDKPVSFADATFEINIKPWTTVLVADINTGATDGTIIL